MKRIMRSSLILVIACVTLSVSSAAHGQQEMSHYERYGYDPLARFFQFHGGVVTAFLAHEAAHVAAGAGKVDPERGSFLPDLSCQECGKGHTQFTALAGFIEGAVTTEIIFRSGVLPHYGPSFTHGMLAFNIALPVYYVFLAEVVDAPSGESLGDLKPFTREERRAVEAVLLTWSAVSAYRWHTMDHPRDPPLFSLLALPLPRGGATVVYAQKF